MQIQKINIGVYKMPDFKGNSASSDVIKQEKTYYPVPTETSKAYATAQINPYKEIETFEIPKLAKGKMYELANGHRVVLIPKSGPTIINTYVKVGNLNEPSEMKESSHILEHMLANTFLKPESKESEKTLSLTGGFYNATTRDLTTNYYLQAIITKPEEFENLVKLQVDALQHSNFNQEQLDKEKEIIEKEVNYRAFDKSNILLAKRYSMQNAFNLSDEESICFTEKGAEKLKDLKKEDLINYYNTFYRPENMITTIVGNIDENSINIISKYFNKINTPKPKTEIKEPKFSTANPIQKTIRKDIQSIDNDEKEALCELTFVAPKIDSSIDELKMEAFNKAVIKKLEDYSKDNKNGFDYASNFDEISLDKNAARLFGVIIFSKEKNVEKDLNILYFILFNLTQNPISQKDLNLIKTDIKTENSRINELVEPLSNICSKKAMKYSTLKDSFPDSQKIDALTPQDIQETAKKIIDLNKVSIVVVHPKKEKKTKETTSFTGNLDSAKFEDIHEYILPNNLKVVIDSRPGISRATVRMDLQAKKIISQNPEAIALMNSTMESEDFKKYLDEKGIICDFDCNSRLISKTFNAESDKTLELINLAKKSMFSPDFNEKDYEKNKNLIKILQIPLPEDAQDKIEKEIFKEVPLFNEQGDVKEVYRDDIKNLHAQFIKNAQGCVTITIPPEQLKPIKKEIFNSLMQVPSLEKHDYSVIFNTFKPISLEKNKIFIETSKNDDSININKYYKIIESGNISDHAGLLILNQILGKGDKSRLFKTIRNEKRMAYTTGSIYNSENTYKKIANIKMITIINADKDNLRKVVEEYDNEVNNLIENPISQEELENAKRNLFNNYLNNIEDSYSRNAVLANNWNSFYGSNYDQALFEAIEKETPEHIQQLAKHYLTQPSLITISGNKEAIEANTKYLSNLGEVVDCKKKD